MAFQEPLAQGCRSYFLVSVGGFERGYETVMEAGETSLFRDDSSLGLFFYK